MTEGNVEASRARVRHKPDWKAILRTQEAGIFLLGLACAVCVIAWFACEDSRKGTILGAVTTHLTGGRAVGISTALGGGLPLWQAILLASLIEGTVVCLFFTAFSLSFKKLISVRLLNDALANVHRSAQTQRTRLLRWGIPGLILFVWFPFFMTGPVVGSVIGFLLGMQPWVVVGVVLSGTVLAIISWTFILNEIVDWASTVGEFLPLMFVCILLIVIVSFRVKRLLEAQQRREPRVDLELKE